MSLRAHFSEAISSETGESCQQEIASSRKARSSQRHAKVEQEKTYLENYTNFPQFDLLPEHFTWVSMAMQKSLGSR
jgi:hypothetical protein